MEQSLIIFAKKLHLSPFVPNAPFLYPLKTSKNEGRERVHVFRGERKGALGTSRLDN